ncbi:unnamed protein product [Protopolystoma xenopodis]|uniref:Uncharacterized protein n=1 Tax=Protopolystoma xenopodis TaxID=117903 RepID=A0A448WE11_9PLAT|nr:unnamed protein product [Protopolystoma xenopodis]
MPKWLGRLGPGRRGGDLIKWPQLKQYQFCRPFDKCISLDEVCPGRLSSLNELGYNPPFAVHHFRLHWQMCRRNVSQSSFWSDNINIDTRERIVVFWP